MLTISNARCLKVGDVLMVDQPYYPPDKLVRWRWFGVVCENARHRYLIDTIRIGAKPDRPKQTARIAESWKVHMLFEDEYPDGVWAFRTRLILEGAIDIN